MYSCILDLPAWFDQGLLQASSEATPLLATGLSVLCDAVDVLPLNHVTVPKSAACDDLVSWLLPHLFQHVRFASIMCSIKIIYLLASDPRVND